MKKIISRAAAILFAAVMLLGIAVPVAFTAETDVADVVAQLEAIDTLQ